MYVWFAKRISENVKTSHAISRPTAGKKKKKTRQGPTFFFFFNQFNGASFKLYFL